MKIIECPRDAMQGIGPFIPTQLKVQYINLLLKAGFDTIDFGSFVSPKAIPQLKDTDEVVNQLDLSQTQSKLLAIVANVRGAEQAVRYPQINYLGFPLSISETFQQRNTNKTIAQAIDTVKAIQNLCVANGKTLVTYISMGFGNPYGDPYSPDGVVAFVEQLDAIGVRIISLADTVGAADKASITSLFERVIPAFAHIEFGAHLHASQHQAAEKVQAAYDAGCRRIDGALKGFGGCPMAEDDLVGNVATEQMLASFEQKGITHGVNMAVIAEALALAPQVFG